MKTMSHERTTLARELSGLLADTYTLYNTTQNFHWNVVGPQFKPLHDLFEAQYTELADAIDTIAERIRTLGFYTPGTLAEIDGLSRLEQIRGTVEAKTMLLRLIEAHRVVIHRLKELQLIAEKQVDEATLDLLVERQRVHEKAVWFLLSQAGEESRKLDATPAHAVAS